MSFHANFQFFVFFFFLFTIPKEKLLEKKCRIFAELQNKKKKTVRKGREKKGDSSSDEKPSFYEIGWRSKGEGEEVCTGTKMDCGAKP